MHNPKSIQKNETYQLLWDFEIQIDYLISARQPEQVIVNKTKKQKTKKGAFRIVDSAVPTEHSVKVKEDEKTDRYFDLA